MNKGQQINLVGAVMFNLNGITRVRLDRPADYEINLSTEHIPRNLRSPGSRLRITLDPVSPDNDDQMEDFRVQLNQSVKVSEAD